MPHHITLMKQWQMEKRFVLQQMKEVRHRSASMLYESVPGLDVEREEKDVETEKQESSKLCTTEKSKVKSDRPLVPFSLLLQV